MSPDIDEKDIDAGFSDRSQADPKLLTLKIANAKADALQQSLPPDAILITSDQVLLYSGKIREKPPTEDDCRKYLRSYARHPATTITAIVILNSKTNHRISGVDTCTQHFRTIPEEVIEQLIEKGDVLNSAGGITVEDELLNPYLSIRQGDLDSFMGLPVRLLRRLLSEIGIRL
ncbi:Inosine triphosphate pyrophosphatase-like protein [Gracilaria domingensis]|nr:Inosine triphosphate pyrophosphatase-like protein [Gracilaria domingensis]